jgi:integrase
MRAKVVLVARMNDRENKFPFVSVEMKSGRILFPVEWKNKERRVKQYAQADVMGFYARYQNNGINAGRPIGDRVSEPLGKDAVAAYTRFLQLDQDFERVQRGLVPINVPADTSKSFKPERNLISCAAKFENDLRAESKKPRAIESYMGRVRNFLRFFEGRQKYIDAITEDDIRDFLRWAQNPKHIKQRSGGHSNNTLHNHLRDIGIFMRRFGVEMPLKTKFWPKKVPKPKRKYSVNSVNEMLRAAETEDERDFVHFLLNTGFRDEEITHAQYGDIDFRKGSINVYAKPEYSWTPKNNKSREQDIDLTPKFLQRMKGRKERYGAKASDLIFPNTKGRPDDHAIRVIQKLIKRAELEEKASLHSFRKTFVTMVANKRGLEQARIWAGHEDVETTQKYLAPDEMSTAQSQAIMEEIFSSVD